MSRYLVVVEYGDSHQAHKLLFSRRDLNKEMTKLKADSDVEAAIVYRDPPVIEIWLSPNCSPETEFK